MKDITKFIGTKTAIHCETQEQFDFIRLLDPGECKIPHFVFAQQDAHGLKVSISIEGKTFYWGADDYYTKKGFAELPATDFMPERKIKGWIWKEGKREKFFNASQCIIPWESAQVGVDFFDSSDCKEEFKKEGVLDLWFQPVYEEEKQFPKDGAPCLVWDEGDNFELYRISNGTGGFYSRANCKSTANTYDNYIELNLTEEQLSKLPFKS